MVFLEKCKRKVFGFGYVIVGKNEINQNLYVYCFKQNINILIFKYEDTVITLLDSIYR